MIASDKTISPKEAHDLANALHRRVDGEVRFDDGSRALYASDLSMYRQVPIGVVIPRTIDDVVETVAICRERQIPILGRGCGTSLAGQTCNVAVVIDFSKYLNKIEEVNTRKKFAWVQPGVVCDVLRKTTHKHDLMFPPDPATHSYCTIGGMIGNNSCGTHTIWGGKTVDNVEELDILTYDGLRMTVGKNKESEVEHISKKGGRKGEIFSKLVDLRDRYADCIRSRYPHIPRRVSGYNLDSLLPEKDFHLAQALVGSESTLVLVLRAKLSLRHYPPKRKLVIVGYPDIFLAGDNGGYIRSLSPDALEIFEEQVLENQREKGKDTSGADLLPNGCAWLVVEFSGETDKEATGKAREAIEKIRKSDHDQTGIVLLEEEAQQHKIWKIRESGVAASRIPGVQDALPSWEDAAVAPENVGKYLREFYPLLNKYNYACTTFGHVGDGCLHTRITFNPKTAKGVDDYRNFMIEAGHLVVRWGGSLSGEHGDGEARGELLPIMFGPDLVQAFREFKSIWDPNWRMNPGKVVDPYPMDQNLRTGPDYHPKPVLTWFQFPDDHGSFAKATERCFGIGKCRSLEGGTMCPSFQVTREEKDCTRGRTRLLFEMLRGDAIHDGWQDEHIKDALDLCLACKGCKGDCPVSVDVATYKAEFLSHYYEKKPRPVTAYSMGQIFRWAEIGSKIPDVVNFVTQTPLLSNIAKSLGGISQHRKVPPFATQTFRSWFAQRPEKPQRKREPGPTVILWADTFNNYFLPHTAKAAVEVLEAAGCHVKVPMKNLCCGRPLYDYGFLKQAKEKLEEILEALRPDIVAGTPVVCLEPSCAAVFRDELKSLLPHNEDARRLFNQTFLLSEYLQKIDYRPPTMKRKAMVHGHCQHKAIMGMKDEEALFKKMGLDAEVLDSGCCGMAGSFGYEEHHRDLSIKCGERVLLPRVREAAGDTLIISNGFSCREQIEQTTPRHALHLAEVIQMAMHQPVEKSGKYIEDGHVQEPSYPALTAVGAAAGIGLLLAGGAYWLNRNRDGQTSAKT